MASYDVRLEDTHTHALIEAVGEFYSLGTAEYQAIKASRRMSSPNVIAVMRWTSPTGTPRQKAWRMGKVYREVPR